MTNWGCDDRGEIMEFNTAYGSVWMVCGVCNESGVVWGVVCKVLCCGLLGFWDLWDFLECLNILNIFIYLFSEKNAKLYFIFDATRSFEANGRWFINGVCLHKLTIIYVKILIYIYHVGK